MWPVSSARRSRGLPASRLSEGLIPARFVSRPNRFIVEAELPGGSMVPSHLADPGRLRELLLPGAELRLRRATGGTSRRTAYSVELVRATAPPRPWVSLVTTRANLLARPLLEQGEVRGAGRGWTVRPEVQVGRSRFDFLLTRPGGDRMLVEVKSVTLVECGTALFPDAPTARGRRHLEELAGTARRGGRCLVLFVVQRADARSVRPHPVRDPLFAGALHRARAAGVLIRAAGFRFSGRGRADYLGPLPVRV